MSTETMSTFFAILALVALVGGVVLLLLQLLSLLVPPVREWFAPYRSDLGTVAVPLAWAVATAATLGSLYYSQIAGYEPCQYCWYQRIAMYPLVVVLGIAALRRDRSVWVYGLPISLIGLAISVYHYQLQMFPTQAGGSCSATAPCTTKYVEQFDFITIPFMAGSGFIAIFALMLLARPGSDRTDAVPEEAQYASPESLEEVL